MADAKNDNAIQGDGENIELTDKPEGEKSKTEVSKLTRDLLQSPEAIAAFEQKLASMVGRNSGYISSLPKCVKRRIKALKRIQSEYHVTESKFYEELHELECKYAQLYKPFLEKRRDIVTATKEPTDSECEWQSEEEDEDEEEEKPKATITEIDETKKDDDKTENSSPKSPFDENTKGIPEFWLTLFKNVDILSSMIQEHDEPILKSLNDVHAKLLSGDKKGFILEFTFGENEYFENTILTKEYAMRFVPDTKDPLDYEGPQIIKCTGCKINWKKGKNVTVKNVKAKQKGKTGPKKMVTKTVKCDSFFNFFSPPDSPEDEEEEDEETQTILMQDYEVGQLLQQTIIPKAVLYFTGEALENDDEDYDYGEEEEGEDYDEDEDPDYKPKPGAEKPGDCKQQ
jgi:nucleosome assembly protein 1-like 1